jgi:hypothetical protein
MCHPSLPSRPAAGARIAVPQLAERVANLRRLAIADRIPCKAINQPVPPFGGLQQNGAAIGAGLRLVEGGNDRFVEQLRNENTLA